MLLTLTGIAESSFGLLESSNRAILEPLVHMLNDSSPRLFELLLQCLICGILFDFLVQHCLLLIQGVELLGSFSPEYEKPAIKEWMLLVST
jgi:hypothetical protein